jgi:hypothetical protein
MSGFSFKIVSEIRSDSTSQRSRYVSGKHGENLPPLRTKRDAVPKIVSAFHILRFTFPPPAQRYTILAEVFDEHDVAVFLVHL